MKIDTFYFFLGLTFVIVMGAIGLSYYGSRPATPADIAAAVAKLEPQRKERFARYMNTLNTLSPKEIGKPLTRSDLSGAVDYARQEDTDNGLRDAQEQALATALPSPTNAKDGPEK